jgi:predicted DNA-binding protein (MmcQ/YjbR family)
MTHHNQLDTEQGRRLLAALRDVCAGLPEVEEIIDGFGHTTFRVRKKSFVIAGMGEAGQAVSIKSDPTTQALLVKHGPYYRTPYIGQHGWVTIDDPLDHDWEQVRELIVDGYRLAAPRRLAQQLDRAGPQGGP